MRITVLHPAPQSWVFATKPPFRGFPPPSLFQSSISPSPWELPEPIHCKLRLMLGAEEWELRDTEFHHNSQLPNKAALGRRDPWGESKNHPQLHKINTNLNSVPQVLSASHTIITHYPDHLWENQKNFILSNTCPALSGPSHSCRSLHQADLFFFLISACFTDHQFHFSML